MPNLYKTTLADGSIEPTAVFYESELKAMSALSDGRRVVPADHVIPDTWTAAAIRTTGPWAYAGCILSAGRDWLCFQPLPPVLPAAMSQFSPDC